MNLLYVEADVVEESGYDFNNASIIRYNTPGRIREMLDCFHLVNQIPGII